MEKNYRICFLGYRNLSVMARSAIGSLALPDTEIRLEDCNVETLQKTVDKALLDGFEIFIAGSANAAEFRRHYHAHLVEIHLRPIDYLLAVKKALMLGHKPVLALYRYGRTVDLPLLESLSGVSLLSFQYEDSAELHERIRNTAGDVIIGAGHANELAESLGKKSVLLYPGEESVKSAIRRARNLAAELVQEIQKNRTVQTIINDAPIGLIVSDVDGNITLFNRAARNYAQLGGSHFQLKGRQLSEILPALDPMEFLHSGEPETDERRLINGAMMRCVFVRIQDRGRIVGVLTTLYPDNSRRKKEDKPVPEQFLVRSSWNDVIGDSPTVKALIQGAKSFASSAYPLLVTGEPGTGKTFYAILIHASSKRKKDPCIPVNTAAIPNGKAAEILFGTEGPQGIRPGLFETAGNGTILLQNLNLASKIVQSCLFQAVSDSSFLRVGGITPVELSARIITILDTAPKETERIQNSPAESIFPPLFQLLSVLSLRIPSLRERREDVPALFDFQAAQEIASEGKKQRLKASSEVLRYYSWPGNLFELSSVCKRYAFLLSQADGATANTRHLLLLQAIGEEKLYEEILNRHPALRNAAKSPAEEVLAGLEDMKRILKYNNETIAEKLSLSRTTLWRITKGAAGES